MLKSSYQQLNKSLNGKKESAKEKKDIEYIFRYLCRKLRQRDNIVNVKATLNVYFYEK